MRVRIARSMAVAFMAMTACHPRSTAQRAPVSTTITLPKPATTASVPPESVPQPQPQVPPPPERVVDLSWINDRHGWALAYGHPCSGKQCVNVWETTDGGRHWALVSGQDRIDYLRFANSRIGYGFGFGTGLFNVTTDGGRTWSDQTTTDAVAALEVAGGTAMRITYDQTGCPGPCTWSVERSPIGSTTWRRLNTPPVRGGKTQLVRPTAAEDCCRRICGRSGSTRGSGASRRTALPQNLRK